MHDDRQGVVGIFIIDSLAMPVDFIPADADDTKKMRRVGRDAEVRPAGVMELRHGTGLAVAGEGDLTNEDGWGVAAALGRVWEVAAWCACFEGVDELLRHTSLVSAISAIPVRMAFAVAAVVFGCQHDDDVNILFPNYAPKVLRNVS